MPGALSGFTVLDVSEGPAAALATMLLAEHGARVLRVVRSPDDARRSGVFEVFDRGKETTALDLPALGSDGAAPEFAVLERLVRGADVLVSDYPPDDPREALFSPDRLRRWQPSLVLGAISACGRHGPWRHDAPLDDLVLARTGVLGGMPGHREAPVHLVHPLPSVGAGILCALGVAAALYRRARTGVTGTVETSLVDGALLYHPKVVAERLEPQVFQSHPSGSAPFYSVYPTGDGRWIQLGCVHQGFIDSAARVLGMTEWLAAPEYGGGLAPVSPEADEAVRDRLTSLLRAASLDTWMARFEDADVPFAEARQTHEALNDPQVHHNAMAPEVNDPVLGRTRQMGVCLRMTGTPGRLGTPRRVTAERNAVPTDWPESRESTAAASTDAASSDAGPPLDGVRVLEITNLIAGPVAARLLADLGADVVKLEPPGGDMSRPIGRTYFYSVNLNKRSVCIDARSEDGRALVHALAGHADALVANLRPGATERMGLTESAFPELVQTHLSGYGADGPYAHRPGIDPLAQALMGLERAQGGNEGAPVFPAQLAPTDFTTGALGAFGTVLALLHRDAGGPAQHVECNLLNAGALLVAEWFTDAPKRDDGSERVRPLADVEQFGLDPFHRLYAVEDGWVYIVADDGEARARLLDALGLDDEQRARPWQAGDEHPACGPLASALARALGNRRRADVLDELRRSGVSAAPAEAPDSDVFLDAPHAIANGVVATCAHSSLGVMRAAWRYVRVNGAAGDCAPTPLLGEQGPDVLVECGVPEAEVRRLLDAGVLRVEAPPAAQVPNETAAD